MFLILVHLRALVLNSTEANNGANTDALLENYAWA